MDDYYRISGYVKMASNRKRNLLDENSRMSLPIVDLMALELAVRDGSRKEFRFGETGF